MRSAKKVKGFRRLDYMHEWVEIARRSAVDELFDMEKLLYGFGLHAKVRVDGDAVLYARKSEAECAKALISGEVGYIVTSGTPEFHLINDDFTYKNDKFLQDNSISKKLRKRTNRTLWLYGLVILFAIAVSYYLIYKL